MVVEEREVYSFDGFKVVVAVFVKGCGFAIHEIVVEGDAHGAFATGAELHGKAFTEGGFARRGGASNEYHFDVVVCGDVVGNFCNLFFLQSFCHIDQIVGGTSTNGFVEFAHGGASKDFLSAVLLLEDVEHLLLFGHRAQLVRLFGIGHADEESFSIGDEVEEGELAGAEEKCAIKIVDSVVEDVVVGVEIADALEKLHLACESLLAEHFDGFCGVCSDAAEGDVGVYDFCHPLAQLCSNLGSDSTFDLEMTVVASGNRSADAEVGVWEEVACGFEEYEKEASRVGAQSREGGEVEKFEVARVVDGVVKTFHAVVDFATGDAVSFLQADEGVYFFERRSLGDFVILACVFAENFDEFHKEMRR